MKRGVQKVTNVSRRGVTFWKCAMSGETSGILSCTPEIRSPSKQVTCRHVCVVIVKSSIILRATYGATDVK